MEIPIDFRELNEQGKLGMEVEEDNMNIQIEDNTEDTSITTKAHQFKSQTKTDIVPLSGNKITGEIIQSSTLPIATGDIAITNSDHIQFGHNTYFNGPVTIIQNKTVLDNLAYTRTKDEEASNSNKESKAEDSQMKKLNIQAWHKVTFTAIFFITIGGITALVLDLQTTKASNSKSQESNSNNTDTVSDDPLVIANNHLRIVSRTDWLAQPITSPLDILHKPVPWVIITHTASVGCNSQSDCVLQVRLIQTFHMESRKWFDIGYNFLVGGDGSAYEGRGWNSVGAHAKGYNNRSISIAFIGTFNTIKPPKRQFDACKKLIRQGLERGEISKDYKLFAHRQLMSTLSPGQEVYNVIKEWPHFFKKDTIDEVDIGLA